MMEISLKNNIFEFNGQLYRQEIGAAMGNVASPNYANIFMNKKLDKKNPSKCSPVWRRYLPY